METKFLIVDGNSLACRAAFAHNPKHGSDLTTFDGKLTGGTYRFFNMFDRILHQIKPTHVVIAWDVGCDTFRKCIYADYKATRERKNEDLKIQFQDIKTILELIGIKNVGIKGFEGDDIVGTYINKSEATKNFIVTGDKDAFQLVSENTSIIYPLNGFKEIQLITPEYIKEKYEIPVNLFIDLKAIMGDDGDNIKGIQGCGEKTAIKLLHHYGNVDEVVKNVGSIDCKGVNKTVKENIVEWAERIDIIKQLVTIRQDVNVPYGFNDCKISLNWENAREVFKNLEFNSFIKKLNGGEFYGS